MNTREEIEQAIADYQAGVLSKGEIGRIKISSVISRADVKKAAPMRGFFLPFIPSREPSVAGAQRCAAIAICSSHCARLRSSVGSRTTG
jgi:hypothetical protein